MQVMMGARKGSSYRSNERGSVGFHIVQEEKNKGLKEYMFTNEKRSNT